MEKNRGRIERRRLSASTQDLAWADWPGLGQFLRLERRVSVQGETTTTVQYAITSLSLDRARRERLLDLWRGRWDIENRLFRMRDVVFGEDASRIRSGTASLSMNHIKDAAMNTLRTLKVPDLFHKRDISTKLLTHNRCKQENHEFRFKLDDHQSLNATCHERLEVLRFGIMTARERYSSRLEKCVFRISDLGHESVISLESGSTRVSMTACSSRQPVLGQHLAPT